MKGELLSLQIRDHLSRSFNGDLIAHRNLYSAISLDGFVNLDALLAHGTHSDSKPTDFGRPIIRFAWNFVHFGQPKTLSDGFRTSLLLDGAALTYVAPPYNSAWQATVLHFVKKALALKSRPFKSGLETEAVAAIEIRDLCLAARADAEIFASGQGGEAAEPSMSRYLLLRDICIEAANKLTDTFYRDLALHQIYGLCKLANDETAKSVSEQIKTANIRGDVDQGRNALFD
jgi:hypothetical protein